MSDKILVDTSAWIIRIQREKGGVQGSRKTLNL